MPLRISFESDHFPGAVRNGPGELQTSWDELLWAAVTVGRPNRHYIFRHGEASVYEAFFRWSLVRMALEQVSPRGFRLRRTEAANSLDPTEKGAVNYFLGLSICKLFAAKLLNTPWLIHLDAFRPLLTPALRGRSRPDLVGKEHRSGRWHSFECKGRSSPPSTDAKSKAKAQAQRLVSVNSIDCTLHIGAIMHYRNDVLIFYWIDPAAGKDDPIKVEIESNSWRHYYLPITRLVADSDRAHKIRSAPGGFVPVEGMDLQVSIYPSVADLLLEQKWQEAQLHSEKIADDLAQAGYQPDGLQVRAGESWSRRFEDLNAEGG